MTDLFNTLSIWMLQNPFDAFITLIVLFCITLWSGWAWEPEDCNEIKW